MFRTQPLANIKSDCVAEFTTASYRIAQANMSNFNSYPFLLTLQVNLYCSLFKLLFVFPGHAMYSMRPQSYHCLPRTPCCYYLLGEILPYLKVQFKHYFPLVSFLLGRSICSMAFSCKLAHRRP